MAILTHEDIDLRLIRMHEVIAERLRANPSLISVALTTLTRWRGMGVAPWAMDQWARLLEGPREELLVALVADTQEMRRLRQSSPFAGEKFIDNRTRWKLIRESHRV